MARIGILEIEKWRKVAHQSGYRAGDFAQNMRVLPRQLRRHTKEIFGCSPQVWLTEQRLVAAAELLKKQSPVKFVAFELRYKRYSHFSRQFKRRYGLPPTAYLVKSDGNDRER